MERALTRLWYGDSGAAVLLQPAAWLYGLAVAFRGRAYRSGWVASHRVSRPVIVVGNLTVGGTGKTPLTAWLACALRERGMKVGIVSRGYGRKDTAPRFVEEDADWREVGDEPLLLRRKTGCATVVAADRVAGARMLIERGIDVILADDGLQHLRLSRDCEIVVVDGARGFGNERLLPAGPLRERVSRLQHADAVVVNGAPEHPTLRHVTPGSGRMLQMRLEATEALPLGSTGTSKPLADFRGQLVHAVAGIGNPARFFRDLRSHGIELVEHAFPDHHSFARADLQFGDSLPVLMTEKDAVKCSAFAESWHWQVPVTARFGDADERELLDRVLRKLA